MTKSDDPIKRLRELAYELDVLVRHLPTQQEAKPPVSNQKKLTRREADRIRDLKRNGLTHQAIADIFDVNRSTITRIINRTYWK